jgi:hypothetical protein
MKPLKKETTQAYLMISILIAIMAGAIIGFIKFAQLFNLN